MDGMQVRSDMIKEIFQFKSFGASDVGLVRERNEDVWAVFPDKNLFILADGMGGHSAGEIASKDAVDHLHFLVEEWNPSKEITTDKASVFFREALIKVNAQIYHEGQTFEELKGMGTTIVSLFFVQNHAILAHVGDSRIYCCREGQLNQLTEDHSLISELLSLGAMKPEDADTFPYKHILTKAVGTHSQVEPSVSIVNVSPGDIFLMCSDGLTNYVSHKELEHILQNQDSLDQKGQHLIDLSNQHGGGDNITLILIEVEAHGDLPRQ